MPTVRSTRSTSSPRKSIVKTKKPTKPKGSKADISSETNSALTESSADEASDAYEEQESAEEEEDAQSLDSDALDEEEDEEPSKSRKRKRVSPARKGRSKVSPRKKKKNNADDDSDEEFDLQEGQEIVGTVVQAPKTGRVPPGQVSQNTFDFLAKLQDPKCNDREWFKLHEPVFRLAEKEWKDFIEEFTNNLVDDVDGQIPHLPPKDVIHRIYRDVRFSNDKTPYKRNFSASFSRGGRKGIFAHYYIQIQPGNQSFLAAGLWCPGKNELETLRSHLLRPASARSFRALIGAPGFAAHFGDPKPKATPRKKDKVDGFSERRTSIFGRDDELKVAPKGVDKNHPDIDLLKCRSFAVVHQFTDDQVVDPNFRSELARVAKVAQPFVHRLNDMISLPATDADSENEEEEAEQDEEDA